MAVEDAPSYADLEQRVARLERELAEARRQRDEGLAREAATGAVLRAIATSSADLQSVLDTIAESAARVCDADDAQLFRVVGDNLRSVAAFGSMPTLPLGSEEPITRDWTAGRAVLDRRTVHIEDLAEVSEDEFPRGRAFQARYGDRTILATPLLREGAAVGAISIRRTEVRPFTDRQIALLETFADEAVIAIENATLFEQLQARTAELGELNRTLEARVRDQVAELERVGRLRRYLSPQLADLIVSSGDETLLEHHRRQITVVFCDLRGFTAFAEIAEPEEVMGVLGGYHAAMGELIRRYEGTLDHFAGDGLMVFFNDPLPQPDHAERAVRMACAMRERAAELARGWRKQGHELDFGVGIAVGYATLGRIGFEGRYDYTAIGTAVNLAARLCDEATAGQILVSGRLHGIVEELVEAESVGELMLKGFHRPVAAFSITGLRDGEPTEGVGTS
jgi:class 3 adenylate cyclase